MSQRQKYTSIMLMPVMFVSECIQDKRCTYLACMRGISEPCITSCSVIRSCPAIHDDTQRLLRQPSDSLTAHSHGALHGPICRPMARLLIGNSLTIG